MFLYTYSFPYRYTVNEVLPSSSDRKYREQKAMKEKCCKHEDSKMPADPSFEATIGEALKDAAKVSAKKPQVGMYMAKRVGYTYQCTECSGVYSLKISQQPKACPVCGVKYDG